MNCHHGCHGCCDHGTSEALREANQRSSNLASENTQLRGEVLNKTKEIGEKDKQVAVVGKDLEFARGQLTKTEGELTVEKEKVKEITSLFNNLRIESGNKDKQIEIQGKDIRDLKAELNKSEERSLERELREQERKLNEFIQKLGISREKPRELQKAYRQLIRARENYNQNDIDEADDRIEDIKDELLSSGWIQRGVSAENIQKLCSKCKKIAEIKVAQGKVQEQRWMQQKQLIQVRQEQEQQQSQYEAQQEVPPHNSN